MILRPYQDKGVEDVRVAFERGARSVLYVLPTGAGKTVIFARISQLCHEMGTRAAIIVHRDTLLNQACQKLDDIKVSYSVIAPGRTNFGDVIQVASVQTLVRRLAAHEFDLIIVDEGHHGIAGSYLKIFDAWPEARILGVTATPCRMDGRGLGEIYEVMVQGPTIAELTADGYLTRADIYGAEHIVQAGRARVTGGDFNAKDIEDIMDKKEITGNAIEHYRDLCPGQPALAFCATIKHAQDVAEEFRGAGFKAESIDGTMGLRVVRERIGALRTGVLQIITSCDLVSEGFDAPGVSVGILLRHTKSLAVYMQQIGRLLRPIYAPGFNLDTRESRIGAIACSTKPHALVLDHVGNAFRHGLADTEREWSLDAKKKNTVTGISLKTCPNCFGYCHGWDKVCKACKHVFVVVPRDADGPEQVDGKLTKLDSSLIKRLRKSEEAAAKTYQELKDLGRRRGHSPKWALHKWLGRGGSLADAK